MRSAAEVDVDVGPTRVCLAVEGVYALQLALPRAVDADGARCRFDRSVAATITMPLATGTQ